MTRHMGRSGKAEVDLTDQRVRNVLRVLLERGPMNQYQIEKAIQVKHATFVAFFKPLVQERYLELDTERLFKTGQMSRSYRISSAGFVWFLYSVARKEDEGTAVPSEHNLWDLMPNFIEDRPELSPFLSRQLGVLRQVGTLDLFTYFVRIYVESMTHMRLTGEPLPDSNAEFKQGRENIVKENLAAFFLRVLYPRVDLTMFGSVHPLKYGEFYLPPRSWSEVTSDSTMLQLVQGQVKAFLRANRDFARFVLRRLAQIEAHLDLTRSGIGATRKDLRDLMMLKEKVHGPSG